jgi:small redox-active disulfide protein 2
MQIDGSAWRFNMKIEVLGTGCAKCKKQFTAAEEAVSQSGVKAEVVKVETIDEILERGVMMTPGLVINGEVVSAGRVLPAKAIAALLVAAAAGGKAGA